MSSMSRKWYAFASKQLFPGRKTNDAWALTSVSIARANSEDSPYLIPNEWICGNLASFLRLPVPPFALMRRTRQGMFASLRFTKADEPPPDTRPEACVRNHPALCAGILLFDIWVANEDRHAANLYVDVPSNPRDIRIFDHDRALFGSFKGYGSRRLAKLTDRLGASGGPITGGNCHCFLDHVSNRRDFDEWYRRIADTPTWFIEDICRHVIGLGITETEADDAIRFLNHRKQKLPEIVYAHQQAFKAIKAKDWGLFA